MQEEWEDLLIDKGNCTMRERYEKILPFEDPNQLVNSEFAEQVEIDGKTYYCAYHDGIDCYTYLDSHVVAREMPNKKRIKECVKRNLKHPRLEEYRHMINH